MPLADLRAQTTRRTPEELIEHLKTFELDLKFSAGVWFLAPGGGRFMTDTPPTSPWPNGSNSRASWPSTVSSASKRIIPAR